VSTNINITVNDSALLDRAKLQQAANRQTQLDKEAALRLEAQATADRTAALAVQGRDANGNFITGAPFTQTQIDRRPAANGLLSSVSAVLAPDPLLISGDTFRAKSRGIKGLISTNVLPFANALVDSGYAAPVFLDGGGPNPGANACESGALPPPPPSPPLFLPTLRLTYTKARAWAGRNASPIVQQSYITSTVYGTEPSGPELPYEVTPEEAAPTKEKISNYSSWTAEAWLRAGSPGSDIRNNTRSQIYVTAPGFSAVLITGAGDGGALYGHLDISIVGVDYGNPPAYGVPGYPGFGIPGQAERFESKIKSWDTSVIDPGYVALIGALPYDKTVSYAFSRGSWHHFAAVYSDKSFKFFLNGELLFTAPVPFLKDLQAKSEALNSNQYIKYSDLPVYLIWGGESFGVSAIGPGAIHGFRFTPKALYDNSFTPPETITNLA
jgi:hypothetical protein